MNERENPSWMPHAPLLLSVFQAAALLNVCPKTVRNLVACGELVGRRIGDRLLIPRTSIETFIKRDHVTRKGKDDEAKKNEVPRVSEEHLARFRA